MSHWMDSEIKGMGKLAKYLAAALIFAVLAAAIFLMLALCVAAWAQKRPPTVCGSERWPVKTLQDVQGDTVANNSWAHVATVAQLTSFPLHGKSELLKDAQTRIAPQEVTVYELHAAMIGFKRETDSDIHIVVADPKNPKTTMIVEIPAGGCMVGKNRAIWDSLQTTFEKDFGHPTAKFKTLPKPIPVDVRGVGFFDFIHGQTGVAKDGFELHPVIHIARE